MATARQQLSITSLRNGFNTYGHAMPFGRVKLCTIHMSGLQAGPLSVFAKGCSVPISRGSPPIS